ncbi:MAG: aldo/keto reductase [Chloroflexi bacterium]|nr:aldo/keto reductase [Chloroflexota bacterium]
MQFKELGRTGVQVPEIGLGTWQYRGGVEPLRNGISLGAFLIDTAEMYGTEDVVGEAVKGMREQVFIATKVSGNHLRYDEVLRAAEQSLGRLGSDYIDLYQVHWPNGRVPIEETMRAMEALADWGLVKHVGVSNFSIREMEEAQASMSNHRIVSNQVEYSLLERKIERDVLPYCQENGITVIAYSPLAKGALASRPLVRHRKSIDVLHTVADEIGKTPAQVAFNWLIARPNVIAIPKANSTERIRENCDASGWSLSPQHTVALERAFSE